MWSLVAISGFIGVVQHAAVISIIINYYQYCKGDTAINAHCPQLVHQS